MNLASFNALPLSKAAAALQKCCGAHKWIAAMLEQHPFPSIEAVFEQAARCWYEQCSQADWLEAFDHHPKIGGLKNLEKKFASTSKWSGEEQAAVQDAQRSTLEALARGNAAYEKKFGYIFIVCATGKSASEMLALLEARLSNAPKREIHWAMKEQEKITKIRLEKLFQIAKD